MMAAGLGEFYLTAERTAFMDIWRIRGGGGGRGGRKNTGTKGWFRGRMVVGIGVGLSHVQALYKWKRSILHTVAVTTRDRAWHLKGKSWHWLHHCHPDCHKAAANIKTFFICAARGYWHQKLFSSPSVAGLLCRSPPLRPLPVTATAQHIGSWCEAIHVHLPLTDSLSPSTLPLQQSAPLLLWTHIGRQAHSLLHIYSLLPAISTEWKCHWITQIASNLCPLLACMLMMMLLMIPLFRQSTLSLNILSDWFCLQVWKRSV